MVPSCGAQTPYRYLYAANVIVRSLQCDGLLLVVAHAANFSALPFTVSDVLHHLLFSSLQGLVDLQQLTSLGLGCKRVDLKSGEETVGVTLPTLMAAYRTFCLMARYQRTHVACVYTSGAMAHAPAGGQAKGV